MNSNDGERRMSQKSFCDFSIPLPPEGTFSNCEVLIIDMAMTYMKLTGESIGHEKQSSYLQGHSQKAIMVSNFCLLGLPLSFCKVCVITPQTRTPHAIDELRSMLSLLSALR